MLLVTHNNSFHADDVFSSAVLKLVFPFARIKRTRDEKYFSKANYVFDIGGKNDGERYFDHHQIGGAGTRQDNYPYASFGLVWKKFGRKLCSSDEVLERVDKNFVRYIDAFDNGYNPENLNNITSISKFIDHDMNPLWINKEDHNKCFKKALKIAKKILLRKIQIEECVIASKKIVEEAIKNAKDGIVILDKHLDWKEFVIPTENKIVVHPESGSTNWVVRAVPIKLDSFDNKISFKNEFLGKRDKELSDITGVDGCIFCHIKGFVFFTKTKEAAIKIAEMTIRENK